MRKLGRRVTTKIADATGPVIDRLDHLFWTGPVPIPHPFSVGPVLTEKTVKRTSVIEYSKILQSIFWTRGVGKSRMSGTGPARADPIGDTVGWQPIIIPTHISFLNRNPLKDPFFVSPQSAIAPSPFSNLTPIRTDRTENT
jgi:hypothetical protein